MDALVSHLQEDNGEKPKNSEVNWKPGSVEEWFESNDRRTKAQKKIQKLDESISSECRQAYDCFLRTQVYQGQTSNLLKKLPEEKKDIVFAFDDQDKIHKVQHRINLAYNMFDDVERQELFIKDISSINAEINVENINDSEEEIGYMGYDQQPEINNTVTSTQLPRINTLPVPPYIDTDAKLMKLLRCQKPVIKRNGFNSMNNNTLPQVTEVPGSRGPKWVAMHQSPYKTVYREQKKK